MRWKLFIPTLLAVAAVLAAAVPAALTQPTQKPARMYLDLSKDRVMPKGVSSEMESQILASGWKKIALRRDIYVHAQFKRESGEYYYVDGWVREGTEIFAGSGAFAAESAVERTVFDGFGVLRACGNPIIYLGPGDN